MGIVRMGVDVPREVAGPAAVNGPPDSATASTAPDSGGLRPPLGGAGAAAPPLVAFDGVSKWYGNVIGVNNLTVHVGPGVTGLLGPNGAGKSTFLQLATGQLRPSMGVVRVLGHVPW